MADIWKIGLETSATEYYENCKNVSDVGSDIFAARELAKICDTMSTNYEQIIEDQNDYLVEINEDLAEIEQLQKELEAQIREQESKRASILAKSEKEELSEEDKTELDELGTNIETLTNDSNSKISILNAGIQDKSKQAVDTVSKRTIARDYADTAIEKGTPMANTKDKRKSFWRKLSGSWDKSAIREAGKTAVNAGSNLLEYVEHSCDIEKEINSKTKKQKV